MYNIIKKKILPSSQGSVIIYALLIILLITVIAVTVSAIIINELKLTTSAANAAMAYYAAESGIERGLYTVKIRRSDSSFSLDDAIHEIQAFTDNSFGNQAEYSDEKTDSQPSEIRNENLAEYEYAQADYYDVNDPLPVEAAVDYVLVSNGEIDDNPDLFSWAEVSWTAWDANGDLLSSDKARNIIGPSDLEPSATQDGWQIDLSEPFTASTPVGYRLRVKALFGSLSNLSVIPYDESTGTQVTDLPSNIVVKAIGTRGNFKQALTAIVPWKVPLSGLYDYVLFSEGEIIKTIILSQPVYSSGVIQAEAENTTVGNCDYATCQTNGWLGDECSINVSCTIQANDTSYCTLPDNSNETFTLPVPSAVPSSSEYYISLRYRADGSGTTEVLIDDPDEGELGFAVDYEDTGSSWVTCTVPESFSLGTDTDRFITYTNFNANDFDLDWYQISSYEIFGDCE